MRHRKWVKGVIFLTVFCTMMIAYYTGVQAGRKPQERVMFEPVFQTEAENNNMDAASMGTIEFHIDILVGICGFLMMSFLFCVYLARKNGLSGRKGEAGCRNQQKNTVSTLREGAAD